jgi:hypothetical protein
VIFGGQLARARWLLLLAALSSAACDETPPDLVEPPPAASIRGVLQRRWRRHAVRPRFGHSASGCGPFKLTGQVVAQSLVIEAGARVCGNGGAVLGVVDSLTVAGSAAAPVEARDALACGKAAEGAVFMAGWRGVLCGTP